MCVFIWENKLIFCLLLSEPQLCIKQ